MKTFYSMKYTGFWLERQGDELVRITVFEIVEYDQDLRPYRYC
jgi:hypothetical protein